MEGHSQTAPLFSRHVISHRIPILAGMRHGNTPCRVTTLLVFGVRLLFSPPACLSPCCYCLLGTSAEHVSPNCLRAVDMHCAVSDTPSISSFWGGMASKWKKKKKGASLAPAEATGPAPHSTSYSSAPTPRGKEHLRGGGRDGISSESPTGRRSWTPPGGHLPQPSSTRYLE